MMTKPIRLALHSLALHSLALHSLALRSLALGLVALAAAFSTAPAAHAQASQAVASPLTTKRLERLLGVYVSPTDEEASAIDRLHEAYLAKFRTELDPEIQAVGRSMGGGMPSQQEFEKFLRDLDRLQAKIADADNAFFDSAANLLAEERRPGMQRLREARERQRQLSGFTRMGPMMFGGGGSFVDLADILARDEFVRQVPEESRAQFDALLRAQEQRLLAQSRNYGQEIRKAFDSMYAIISEAEQAAREPAEGADGGDPAAQAAAMQAQMQRMQVMMQRMKELGKEANRVAALNAEANRAALRQFAPVLPELSYHRLRADLARRSMGAMGMFSAGFGGGGLEPGAGDLATLLARLRRDPEVTADMRARFAPIELAWRRERADNAEKLAELTSGLDRTEMMMGGMNADGTVSESLRAVQQVVEGRGEIDQRAYRAVLEVIGSPKGDQVFRRISTTLPREDGTAGERMERLEMNVVEPETMATEAEPENSFSGVNAMLSLGAAPSKWTAQQLANILKPLAVPESSVAILEAIVEGWTAKEWTPKVEPLGKALKDASMSLYAQQPDGSFGTDPASMAKVTALRRQLVEAIFAADAALISELGTALGLDPGSAEILLLRLERVAMAADPNTVVGGMRTVSSPSRLLTRADLPPDAARAYLESSSAEWKAFADGLPADILGVIERADRLQLAVPRANASDWESYQRVMRDNTAANEAFHRRLASVADAAAARASDRPEIASALKRARLALARPDVYKASESATPQLTAALALDGLRDDQRARLDALKAEYDAVYEMLSERIATGDESAATAADGEAWRAMQERMEAEQKLFFQRNERTEKARSEARRILGDELAARVRGLVPDEADAAKPRQANRFDPFAEEDD